MSPSPFSLKPSKPTTQDQDGEMIEPSELGDFLVIDHGPLETATAQGTTSTEAGPKYTGISSAIDGLLRALHARRHTYDTSSTVHYTNLDTYEEGHRLLRIFDQVPGIDDRRSQIRKAVIKIREEGGKYTYDAMSDYLCTSHLRSRLRLQR
jgi:hypothetical protein